MITLNGGDVVMTGLEKHVVDVELKARASRIFNLETSMQEQDERILGLVDKIERLQTKVIVSAWREEDNFENMLDLLEDSAKYQGIDFEWRKPTPVRSFQGDVEIDDRGDVAIGTPSPR